MIACTELVTGYDDFGKIIFLQAEARDAEAEDFDGDEVCPQCDRSALTGLDAVPADVAPRKARRGFQALLKMLRDPQSSRDISRVI
ncbi:MAG: hypothetical protein AAF580_09680 [Pseudomonadota bacterium]